MCYFMSLRFYFYYVAKGKLWELDQIGLYINQGMSYKILFEHTVLTIYFSNNCY